MPEDATLITRYEGWERYEKLLEETIAPLSDEQLAVQSAPHMWPAWMLAAHIISVRVGWFRQLLTELHGEDEFDRELLEFYEWDAEGAPQRSASELVEGLATTWDMVEDCLSSWTPDMLARTIMTKRGNTRTFQWVIWHVLEHDMHHGGELAQTLGMHKIPVPEL